MQTWVSDIHRACHPTGPRRAPGRGRENRPDRPNKQLGCGKPQRHSRKSAVCWMTGSGKLGPILHTWRPRKRNWQSAIPTVSCRIRRTCQLSCEPRTGSVRGSAPRSFSALCELLSRHVSYICRLPHQTHEARPGCICRRACHMLSLFYPCMRPTLRDGYCPTPPTAGKRSGSTG